MLGTLAGLNDAGEPVVQLRFALSKRLVRARSTVPIDADQVGQEVVIAFEGGDTRNPIVLGFLSRAARGPGAEAPVERPTVSRPIVQATLDGDQLVLTAAEQIVLRCGRASLTLTREGKVLIRGSYLLSRSSGANRIKGASVQLN